MKLGKIGAIFLGTALVFQTPFQVFATSLNGEEQVKKEATVPKISVNKQALTATSDLEQTVGEEITKTIHLQDQALPNSEWGSYISDVKVTLSNMNGISYDVKYGPLSEDGTHYQYADIILSGTPTKAGTGSISLEYYDGAGNGGVFNYSVNTKSKTTIQYVDGDGNKLAEDTVKTGDLNTAYTSEPKTIDGYEVDETKLPSNQNGQFAETNQTVTYTYSKTKSEVNKGTVGISFYAPDGSRRELKSALDLSYAYPDGVPSDTVTFGDLAKNTTYKDLRNTPEAPTILWNDLLHYMVDYMNGDIDAAQFEEAVGLTPANFDLDYITRNFEGYKFDEAMYQENLSKLVTFEQDGDQVYLQVPFKKVEVGADITVKYVDTEGNELASVETLSGNVDVNYTSEAKTIDGWTLKETPNNATGVFSKEAQTVTYVYEKNDDTDVTPAPDNSADTNDETNSSDNTSTTDDTNNRKATDDNSNSTVKEEAQPQVKSPKAEKVTTQEKASNKITTQPKESLPKTGDNVLESSLLVGLGILLLGGLFVFLHRTKKVK
ncbi:MucBP domain-containing protein [Listeria sp. FSL L7-1699]|uniref:MucBP domain-containing protein n=1 Tax=Listeria farberi TaxID=2713500 RepID=A0ABR6SLS1_9LIST|nr:MucBP domain-containing protein [Listeria farberi]MBC1374999.1 MucBP domain-containing protein [Listeria farberi]MBC1380413.1 MucBP domain-containing protein [Listeria farberi]